MAQAGLGSIIFDRVFVSLAPRGTARASSNSRLISTQATALSPLRRVFIQGMWRPLVPGTRALSSLAFPSNFESARKRLLDARKDSPFMMSTAVLAEAPATPEPAAKPAMPFAEAPMPPPELTPEGAALRLTKEEKKKFYDSRERYNMFVNSTSEKWQTSRAIIDQLKFLNPSPPSLNIFDAGLGDGSVLSRVLARARATGARRRRRGPR